jgi:hypothetical protein
LILQGLFANAKPAEDPVTVPAASRRQFLEVRRYFFFDFFFFAAFFAVFFAFFAFLAMLPS